MKISITHSEATKQKRDKKEDVSVVHLFGRDEEGRRVELSVTDFKPYFWMEEPDERALDVANEVEKKKKNVLEGGKELYKLSFLDKSIINKVEDFGKKNYESDVLFDRRLKIDKKIKSGVEVDTDNGHIGEAIKENQIEAIEYKKPQRFCFLDIEVNSPSSTFPISSEANYPIILLTFYDSYSDETIMLSTKELDFTKCDVITCDDEEQLLRRFIQAVDTRDFDCFTGWNVGGFDIQYIINRMKENDIPISELSPLGTVKPIEGNPDIMGRDILELRDAYLKLQTGELRSYTLEHISEHEELSTSQIPIDDFNIAWNNNPEKVAKHNYADVINMVELDKKKELTNFFINLSNITGLNLSETLNNSIIVDMLFLRYAHERNVVLPSRDEDKRKSYKGGKVLSPEKGIHENVLVLDFSSFYPSIIQAFNISPETKFDNYSEWEKADEKTPLIDIGDGVKTGFSLEEKGMIPKVTKEIMEMREKKKEKMERADDKMFDKYFRQQRAYKFIINSMYGILGYPSFRLFDWKIAQSITYISRDILTNLANEMEKKEYNCIYGDTDSIFVKMKEKTEKEKEVMSKLANFICYRYINNEYEIGSEIIELEPEKVFSKLIMFDKKKKYATRVEDATKTKSKYTFTGLAAGPRTTASNFTTKLQKKLLKYILNDIPKEKIKEVARKDIRKFRYGKIPLKEIGVPTKLNKDPSLGDYRRKTMNENGQTNLITGQVPSFRKKEVEGYSDETMWKQAWENTKKYLGIEFRKLQKPLRVYTNKGIIFFKEESDLQDLSVDYEKMGEKSVKNKIEMVLNICDLEWEDVAPEQYTTLEMYERR